MNVGVVIPAAGQGKRMGTKESKQFLLLDQRPIVLHTLQVFDAHAEVDEIIVAVKQSEIERVRQLIATQHFHTKIQVVAGGRERQESVYIGLQQATSDIVMVHDAVRPFVTQQAITRLIAATREHNAAILAVPAKDTIKQVTDRCVLSTLQRDMLWSVQTPQSFRRELLLQAHEHGARSEHFATDDSALVEALGAKVHVVDGEYTNIKITTPEDLIFAEAIYQMRG